MAMARKKKIELRTYNASAHDEETQHCEWPGCEDHGEFRAPKSRNELKKYRWFCLNHIRQFNRSWNYYDGMNDEEVEADKRGDTVWQRPTWKIGDPDSHLHPPQGRYSYKTDSLNDPFGVFGENGPAARNPYETEDQARFQLLNPEQKGAAKVFDMETPFDSTEVKARYKELVKQYHPDAAGSNKSSEEKIRQINEAYSILLSLAE